MSWEQKMTNDHFFYQEDKDRVTYVLHKENATNSHQYEISTQGQLELHSPVMLIESIDLDSDKPIFITETTTVKNIFISNGRAFLVLHSRPEVFVFQKA
jgi:hypothetical protein